MKKAIVSLVGVVALLLIISLFFGKGFGFGTRNGSGNGEDDVSSIQNTIEQETLNVVEEETSNNKVIVIKVEESKIFFDNEECKDIQELRDQICEVGDSKTYVYEHKQAIKATADEVKETLNSLKDSLGIEIEMND